MRKRIAALLATAGATAAVVAMAAAPAQAENHWGCVEVGQFCVTSGYHWYGWQGADGNYSNNHYSTGNSVDNTAVGVKNRATSGSAQHDVYFFQLSNYGGTHSWCVGPGQSYDFNNPTQHHQWWVHRPSSHKWYWSCSL